MRFTTTAPEEVGMSSERLKRIQPAMEAWIDRGTLAGVSMMVARRNKVVYSAEFGDLDKESGAPMPDDALFRIYSMTKPIVCTALMTLYEAGYFQLFTPVEKFIPALGKVKVLPEGASTSDYVTDLEYPITVGDLMRHTAGFTYDFLEDSPAGELYREAQIGHNAGRTLEQFVQALAELPLAYQPGSRWHYSVSIDVAGHLIEVLSDQPLRDFLRERIFTPLGMEDTDFCVPESKLPRLATMYGVNDILARDMTHTQILTDWQRGKWGRLDVSQTYPTSQPDTFARGGHGLFSTTADYMRFALMLFNNGTLDGARVLGRKTVELMHTNHIPPAQLPLMHNGLPIKGYGFGLGSRTLMDVGIAEVPGSVGEYGWSGAAKTYYWIDPAEDLVGVFMTQYQGEDAPTLDFRVLTYGAIVD